MAVPAYAQIELTGSYAPILYEDYIERGPGSDLGDFTGMPMTDEGRAKALLYTSNLPSTIERQCLAQAPWVLQYRPLGMRIWSEVDKDDRVVAWKIGGDYLRDKLTIWMDGRPEPSPNALLDRGGLLDGKWEGDTLTVRPTHVKTTWIRRGNGIPASDQTTYTVHLTLHDDLLTVVTIQEDPFYLTEPHVVSRVFKFDPRANQGGRSICNTANEIPRLEDSGIVPHYLPGQESGSGLHDAHVQPAEGSGAGVRRVALPGIPPQAEDALQGARVMRPLLLRMDRAPGVARRGTRPELQRRRARRAQSGCQKQARCRGEIGTCQEMIG